MAKFEVTTDLIVHCKVRVLVQAEDNEGAIEAAANLLPANHDLDRAQGWKAKVEFKAPKGVDIKFLKAVHFEQASGSDTAKQVKGK